MGEMEKLPIKKTLGGGRGRVYCISSLSCQSGMAKVKQNIEAFLSLEFLNTLETRICKLKQNIGALLLLNS